MRRVTCSHNASHGPSGTALAYPGTRVVQPPALSIPADEAWFWTSEWQARIAEAEIDRITGNSTVYASEEEFLAGLDGE